MAANNKNDNRNLLLQYAGFGVQLLVCLGIAVFAGLKLDEWIKWNIPVFTWLFPLVVLIFLLIKAVSDTKK